ncbi:MAG: exodeoxyribonuclease VII large subunit [Aquabacterium sp.]
MNLDQAWDVSALLAAAGDALSARFGGVTVRGELSGFTRAASGHCYFTLKDRNGQPALLRCAMFRRAASLLSFVPRDGQQVELRGRVAVFEARGELQCVVEAMLPLGQGALYEQFLRLRARLSAEGLFADARKRPIPRHPRCIGVVSSLAAAALADVLTALRRRSPHVRVVVYPAAVQGADAPPQLVQALRIANQRQDADVLLLCRGGGSLEDLWSFNDESVVRAVAASALPVICGVGHETDVTLSDLAADLRAPTPTAAAELAAPPRDESLVMLAGLAARRQMACWQRLESAAQRLDVLQARLAARSAGLPVHRQRLDALEARRGRALRQVVDLRRQRLGHAQQRLGQALQHLLQGRQQRLEAIGQRLPLLDPQQVLNRGYALVLSPTGGAVRAPSQLEAGQVYDVRLAEGRADLVPARVTPQKER